jgi:MFS family permease
LQLIALDLHASAHSVGLVSVMMQAGYAVGILAFVPLGDIVQPRPLVVGMFVAVAVMLAAAAAAPNVTLLAVAALAIGTCTTCAQVVVPYAADLASASFPPRKCGCRASFSDVDAHADVNPRQSRKTIRIARTRITSIRFGTGIGALPLGSTRVAAVQ